MEEALGGNAQAQGLWLESAVEYLETKGIGLTKGPVNLGTSIRAELKDPDGLTIELRQWFK